MSISDKQFKRYYTMMNGAPILKNSVIEKEINRLSYDCTYLPRYSPELNPIDKFWYTYKAK